MRLPSCLQVLASAGTASAAAATCTAKTFKAASPDVLGIQVLDILATEVKGHEWNVMTGSMPPLPVNPEPTDFCNVTVFYTHPGLNDTARVSVWLPLKDTAWNGRFLGQGGGGWAAGNEGALVSGVAMGFAAANTDSGHSNLLDPISTMLNSGGWSLTSPGNVNLHLLQNFGYRAVDEMSTIGKHITQTYYKKEISYSYWNGCSTGGRQGLVLAQRYPTQYQGILAVAPAINWVTFLVSEYYAHVKMHQLNYFPPKCELDALSQAAIEACDGLDGLKDGLVGASGLCNFDPYSMVGKTYDCEGDSRKITKEAAEVAAATWNGPSRDGKRVWFGLTHEASLTGVDPMFRGLATTACDKDNNNCRSSPFPISEDWIKHWLLKNPNFDFSKIDHELYWDLFRISRQEYHSIMDSADPDLTRFQSAGGKMITWHGLADQLIPPNGTVDYYQRVEALIPKVRDFYRLFEAPGVQHCAGGPGAFPATAINQLMAWVENGKAPEYLDAATVPAMTGNPEGTPVGRKHCVWPKVAVYTGGDDTKAESFECRDGFASVNSRAHSEL